MSTAPLPKLEERVLLLAPTGRDAELTHVFLEQAEMTGEICRDIDEVTQKLREGCAALVLAEETLGQTSVRMLIDLLADQPSWSEIPICVITSSGEATSESLHRLAVFGSSANVTLLERPFRPVTLVNSLRVALRSRRRQYQVRDLLDERETVLKSINDSFVTLDRDWRYIYVNERAAELIGKKREEILGTNLWKWFPEYVGTQHYQDIHRALETQEIVRFEHFLKAQDRWLDVRVYPSPRGVSILTVDITERKRVEEKLESTVAERTVRLRETIGELEAFSYSVSHDLRSPLRAMQAFSQALIEDFGDVLPPEGRRYVERIASAAIRLDKLITDVLTYSQVLRAPLELRSIDLHGLLGALIDQYPTFQPFKANICIHKPMSKVMGHEGSLTQCITNLISNALKFIPRDRAPRVEIRTEPVGDQVRIVFSDNGIGIAAKDQDRVFGMFQRVHPEKNYEGTGIGLAIVRKAVERMGGTLGLESEEGRGSKFWIQLPKG